MFKVWFFLICDYEFKVGCFVVGVEIDFFINGVRGSLEFLVGIDFYWFVVGVCLFYVQGVGSVKVIFIVEGQVGVVGIVYVCCIFGIFRYEQGDVF